MSDALTATSDLIRKRSRSSSPSADSPSASKKANLDPSGPSNLTVDSDDPAAPSSVDIEAEADDTLPSGESPAGQGDATVPAAMQTDDDTKPSTLVAPTDSTAMVVDSDLPVNPASIGAAPAPSSEDAAATAAAAASIIQMRALIVTQDASIIIGKGGKNVNEIREKSGSKINISESVPGNPERVMIIGGQLDAVSKVRPSRSGARSVWEG